MSFAVRFTEEAEADLLRFYDFILERDDSDWDLAQRALQAIKDGLQTLASTPFTCRKMTSSNPFLRELVIPFGPSGYVALFEIDSEEWVTVLAVRHQREEDYH
jgi:plasmid stabilization system protein ParE